MDPLSAIKNWNMDSTWWHYSYFWDWLATFVVWVLTFTTSKAIKPQCTLFDPQDPTIGFPFSENPAFPSWTIPVLNGIVPCILAIGVVWVYAWLKQECVRYCKAHDLHHLVLAVVQAMVLAMLVTDILKNYTGRPRPDYVSRLEREIDGFDRNNPMPDYLDVVCSSSSSKVWDGRRSFPSGHSSMSFAGWTVFAFFVTARAGGLQVPQAASFWRLVLIVLVCFTFPFAFAFSRTRDFRHNYSDVLGGICIGIASAWACFCQHFDMDSKLAVNRKAQDPQKDNGVTKDDAVV